LTHHHRYIKIFQFEQVKYKVKSNEIRESFLKYFESKQHKILPSSSLVPYGDPTLLFTTAGMVQIKPYFLGLSTPPNKRLASCQKCFRTTDLDIVGDNKHLTFFEMLGNFSVGDYFKNEAIEWGWEYITKYLKIPPEKLWITIFTDDDDAFTYWRKIGIPPEKIVRLGEKDNFWGPAGDSGPCGPCSEIHYDFGIEKGCGKPDCNPSCSCGRFSEIWNLVFTEYNQDVNGKRTKLPKPNIDTGMGLERIVAVMQGVHTVYETDLFIPIRDKICNLAGIKYGQDENTDRAVRVIAEHSRGLAFLIADGVMPSNEGRGYVLRRILRKASFFGRRVGINKLFLGEITGVVIEKMDSIYPDLTKNKEMIMEVVALEEEKFGATLDTGINLVERLISELKIKGGKSISGTDVFRLYDTYGFLPELTAEIAQKEGLEVDLGGFKKEMEKQRDKARAEQKFSGGIQGSKGDISERVSLAATVFKGYSDIKSTARIIYIGDNESGKALKSAGSGYEISVVLNTTPFYAEKGGQVGDTGKLTGKSFEIEISNTVPSPYGVIGEGVNVHLGKVLKGTVKSGDEVDAVIDIDHRLDIARNHTATHLLQAALRQVLGNTVYQRGSYVGPDRLRFDFSYMKAIDKKKLLEIQQIVNNRIRENFTVTTQEMSHKQAISEGAMAIFEEKYGDNVRVLKIGDPPVSMELCGGTHVRQTGDIGFLNIVSESSIGTGLRRVEAVTGREAERYIKEQIEKLEAIAINTSSSTSEAPAKVVALLSELSAAKKRIADLERQLSKNAVDDIIKSKEQTEGVNYLVSKVEASSMVSLREIGDLLKDKLGSAVIVLGAIYDEKPGFVVMVTPDLVQKGFNAGQIVKQVASKAGGGGGGRPELAQAGGKDVEKIDEALALAREIIRKCDHA
jgi:alanyl-tRNA synthetase